MRPASLLAVCVALVAFAAPAGAFSSLDLAELDLGDFGSVAGAVHSTITNSYDFNQRTDVKCSYNTQVTNFSDESFYEKERTWKSD